MIELIALGFWALAIYVGHQIGKKKNRSGWVWAFLLGWVGVLILALLPANGKWSDDHEIAALERQVRLDELRARQRELAERSEP